MNKHQKMVKVFHQAFGRPNPDKPTLDEFPFELRVKLILEEAYEFAEAAGFQPTNKAPIFKPVEPNFVEMIDALCDLLYVTYGAAVAAGVDLEPFFEEVQRSNMAKLGSDGKPIYWPSGKVKKPEGWEPPNLARILARIQEE